MLRVNKYSFKSVVHRRQDEIYWPWPNTNLIAEAYELRATDVETSRSLYFEAQKLLIDEAVGIFLYDPQDVLPMSASVKGEPVNQCYPRVIFFYNLYE